MFAVVETGGKQYTVRPGQTVEVELLPRDVADGHDRQLEEGVRLVLEDLKTHPVPEFKVPPYPNYHKSDGLGRE